MVDGEKDGAEVDVMVGVVGVWGRLVGTLSVHSWVDTPGAFLSLCAAGFLTSRARQPRSEEVRARLAPRGPELRRRRR